MEQSKRRAWVKNAIIIFLVIMLILTFFPNTIMNHSLPEVAAQYAMSGSITSKIRTSSTVKANSTYEIKIDESRVVKAVAVGEGDEVQIGDVLFYLEDAESSQLTQAREQLASLEKQYQLKLLVMGEDYYSDQLAIDNKQTELTKAQKALSQIALNVQKISELESQLEMLEADQKALNKQIAAYEKEIAKLRPEAADTSIFSESTAARLEKARIAFVNATNVLVDAEMQHKNAQRDLETAEAELERATNAWENLKLDGNTSYDSVTEQIAQLTKAMRRDREDYERAYQKLFSQIDEAYAAYTEANSEYNRLLRQYNNGKVEYTVVESALADAEKAKATYDSVCSSIYPQLEDLEFNYKRDNEDDNEQLAKLEALLDSVSGSDRIKNTLDLATARHEDASEAASEASDNLDKKNKELSEAESNYLALQALKQLEDHEATLEDFQNQAETYATRHDELTGQISKLKMEPSDESEQRELITRLSQELNTLKHNFEIKKAEQELVNQREQMEIDELLADIDEQKALIDKYVANSTDAKITATIAGQVTSLSVVAGQETSIGQTMCEIVVTELGYACEITLSADQARRVRVGDAVEVTNTWWSNIKGTLVSLRNDPKNPGGSRIGVISLEGDVTVGQSLNLTIGEKGQTYDTVVPNSAIREDNNGKFVLVVEAKSSPLGNRYIARRYDVEVLASDDTNSAVNGLMGSEFIITTSQAPITNGNQVRLVEN